MLHKPSPCGLRQKHVLLWFLLRLVLFAVIFAPTGGAVQRPLRAGESPRCCCLEPLHVQARVQFSGQPGPRGVQAFPFPRHRGHSGYWPEETLRFCCQIQRQGEISLGSWGVVRKDCGSIQQKGFLFPLNVLLAAVKCWIIIWPFCWLLLI